MNFHNGDYYNGYWKNDLKEGSDIMKYINDDYYNAYWK